MRAARLLGVLDAAARLTSRQGAGRQLRRPLTSTRSCRCDGRRGCQCAGHRGHRAVGRAAELRQARRRAPPPGRHQGHGGPRAVRAGGQGLLPFALTIKSSHPNGRMVPAPVRITASCFPARSPALRASCCYQTAAPSGRSQRQRLYTPVGYVPVIVGQKRRITPPLTHDDAAHRFQALFRTRTGEMSAAPIAPPRTWPLLTHNLVR